uniref:Uncharacterized protein n=2 Tax=Picea TaxID=3328 RepID=A0A117NIR6_PICGL|nr:hypothetical protein ABT39_MTgene231 [Picea glauca]QHR90107.1 hypothetical protein Q903MT_gene4130 [Picea sitchensis]
MVISRYEIGFHLGRIQSRGGKIQPLFNPTRGQFPPIGLLFSYGFTLLPCYCRRNIDFLVSQRGNKKESFTLSMGHRGILCSLDRTD